MYGWRSGCDGAQTRRHGFNYQLLVKVQKTIPALHCYTLSPPHYYTRTTLLTRHALPPLFCALLLHYHAHLLPRTHTATTPPHHTSGWSWTDACQTRAARTAATRATPGVAAHARAPRHFARYAAALPPLPPRLRWCRLRTCPPPLLPPHRAPGIATRRRVRGRARAGAAACHCLRAMPRVFLARCARTLPAATPDAHRWFIPAYASARPLLRDRTCRIPAALPTYTVCLRVFASARAACL